MNNDSYFAYASEDTRFCYYNRNSGFLRENMDLYLVGVGRDKCVSNWEYGPIKRKHYYLHFVVSGKGELWVKDKHYRLAAGDAFYFSEKEIPRYRADNDEPWEYIWLEFDGTKVDVVLGQTDIPQQYVLHDTDDQYLRKWFFSFLENASRNNLNVYQVTGKMYDFLGGLIERYGASRCLEYTAMVYLDAATQYIERHFQEANLVGKMSAALNLSREYLFRLFRGGLGVSPSEYITRFRIRKACFCLQNREEIPISDLAVKVGYTEYSAFYKKFKILTGMTPSEYRERYAGDEKSQPFETVTAELSVE